MRLKVWGAPFWEPGAVWRSIAILIPYFLAHWKARRIYFQHVRGKKGSPAHTSIAHQGMGNRIQLSPAPAISAKSCSIWTAEEEGGQ